MTALAFPGRRAVVDRHRASPQRGRRVGWWCFCGGLALYLTLSAQSLLALGIPYDAPWGPPATKLHPGTWLVAAGWLALLSSHGHPARVAAAQLASQPLLAVYLGGIAGVFGWTIARHGISGAAFVIDTLLMPAVAALAAMLLETERRRRAVALIVALVALNSLVGIGESLVQQRLVPLRLAGEIEVVELIFRPSALLGHPLANALVTATVLPLPFFLRAAPIARGALALFFWLGTLAFGGRTSVVLASLLYGAYYAVELARALARGRFSYVQVTGGALLAMLVAALLAAAVLAGGIGARVLGSLAWDASAAVRMRIWEVFGLLSDLDLLIGVPPKRIAELIWRLGLHGPGETIENFWLYMLLQLGVVGFAPFALAMAALIAWLWRAAPGALRCSVALFFVSASTSNSLASKTIGLTVLLVAVALVRGLDRRKEPRA